MHEADTGVEPWIHPALRSKGRCIHSGDIAEPPRGFTRFPNLARSLAASYRRSIHCARAIAEHADRMHRSVDVFLDLAAVQGKLDNLRVQATALRS
jgi:hypothetical protein